MLALNNVEVIYSDVILVLKGLSLAVEFFGARIDGRDPESIVRMGIFQVMEGRRVFEELTVEENLRVGAYTRRDRAGVQPDYDLVCSYFPDSVSAGASSPGTSPAASSRCW